MADAIPDTVLALGDGGEAVVLVGESDTEAADIASLLRLAPGLVQPPAAVDAALAVNHLAQGADFAVIEDPAAYESAYRARVAAENPDENWSQDKVRLRDYGMPEFEEIQPPAIAGNVLTFFASDSYLGVPYKVVADLGAAEPKVDDDSYEPLDLTPFPGPAPTAGSGGSGIVDEDED